MTRRSESALLNRDARACLACVPMSNEYDGRLAGRQVRNAHVDLDRRRNELRRQTGVKHFRPLAADPHQRRKTPRKISRRAGDGAVPFASKAHADDIERDD